jgi:hypothetical protein
MSPIFKKGPVLYAQQLINTFGRNTEGKSIIASEARQSHPGVIASEARQSHRKKLYYYKNEVIFV